MRIERCLEREAPYAVGDRSGAGLVELVEHALHRKDCAHPRGAGIRTALPMCFSIRFSEKHSRRGCRISTPKLSVHREDESENSWRWATRLLRPGSCQVGQNVRLDLVLKEDPLVLAKSEALSQAPMSMIVSLSAREG